MKKEINIIKILKTIIVLVLFFVFCKFSMNMYVEAKLENMMREDFYSINCLKIYDNGKEVPLKIKTFINGLEGDININYIFDDDKYISIDKQNDYYMIITPNDFNGREVSGKLIVEGRWILGSARVDTTYLIEENFEHQKNRLIEELEENLENGTANIIENNAFTGVEGEIGGYHAYQTKDVDFYIELIRDIIDIPQNVNVSCSTTNINASGYVYNYGFNDGSNSELKVYVNDDHIIYKIEWNILSYSDMEEDAIIDIPWGY